MQLQPNMQTGSIAGTPQAAKRGGGLQSRTQELANAQAVTNNPIGKSESTDAVDAGDQAGDRHGDGRQGRDTFERSDDPQMQPKGIEASERASRRESEGVDYQA